MKTTIELVGKVDANHRLTAEVPSDVAPGDVRISLEIETASDDEQWQQSIAADRADGWNDPREDIYTLDDGEPVDGGR